MLLACSFAALAALSQDPPREVPLVERIDALIAKTNAYEGFEADYRYHFGPENDGTIVFLYRAPDRMKCQVTSAAGSVVLSVRGPDLQSRTHNSDGSATSVSTGVWRWVSEFDRRLNDRLQVEFAGAFPAEELLADVIPGFSCHLDQSPVTDGFRANIGLFFAPFRHSGLSWLDDARASPELRSEGSGADLAIEFTPHPTGRVSISAQHGFVTRVEKLAPGGSSVQIELMRLDLLARPEEREFELPAAEEGSRDRSLQYSQEGALLAQSSALECLARGVARMLDQGQLEWTSALESRLENLLRWQNEELVPQIFRSHVERSDSAIKSLAGWIPEALGRLSPVDRAASNPLAADIARARAGLEWELSVAPDEWLKDPFQPVTCNRRPSLVEDLRALDAPILSEVYLRTIQRPQLAKFDSEVARLLAQVDSPAAPPPVAGEVSLASLIGKVNACPGFVARYRLHFKDGMEGRATLLYRAPDRYKTQLQLGSGRWESLVRGDALESRAWGENRRPTKACMSVRNAAEASRRRLERLAQGFTGLVRPGDLPGAYRLSFSIGPTPEPGAALVTLGEGRFGYSLLRWLDEARQQLGPMTLELEGQPLLCFSPVPGCRAFVSTETGFLTRVEARQGAGLAAMVELDSLDLDAPPAEAEFQSSDTPADAQDVSAREQSLQGARELGLGRGALGEVLAHILDARRVDWSRDLEQRITQVMREQHAEDLPGASLDVADSIGRLTDQRSQWLKQSLSHMEASNLAGRQDLARRTASLREELQRMLDEHLADLLATPYPLVACERRPTLRQDLAALEEPILRDVYAAKVGQPLLAAYDEKVGKQLEAK